MPPTKTLSTVELSRAASSKPKPQTSKSRTQTKTPAATASAATTSAATTSAATSALSEAQFLQVAAKKPVSNRARKASLCVAQKPNVDAQKSNVDAQKKRDEKTEKSNHTEASTSAPTIRHVKAKRPRVPKDLATTYGENVKQRAETAPAKERKTRKTALQREQRRALMTPDDDILQRLARAQTTTTSIKSAPKRRTKKWESRCGKCGVVTAFITNAALCSRCGAIAVRD